ncbi:MAG TPA: AraC family transcriptional regulator [Dongiaceae bacterium]|nr:AraC family transcriptional regulator [Dongiaceae bacterium]
MSQDNDNRNFSRYFPASVRDRKWGWYVTTVGESRIAAGQAYPPGGHPKGYQFDWSRGRVLDCHALVYISRGRGIFESKRSSEHAVEAGQVMVLFPGIWHRYRPDPETGWEEHWLGFDGDIIRRWVKHGFFTPRSPVFKTNQEDRWLALFSELITVVKLDRPALQQVMAGFTAQMLGLLYAGHQAGVSGGGQALLIVQQAIARMRSDMGSGLDAPLLARELNISYSSFRHTFQQHTGSSPHQYLLELRLARARNLLEQTSCSIKEIAQQAGFEDEHYFCRFFKQKTGVTPGQWRAQLQAKRKAV